jgi:hypothetical protein
VSDIEPDRPNVEFLVAPENEGGVYANALSVWHPPHEFSLDFCSTLPMRDDGRSTVMPLRVVSRVKIPVTLIFDVLRALNDNMTRYERAYGEIRWPRKEDG